MVEGVAAKVAATIGRTAVGVRLGLRGDAVSASHISMRVATEVGVAVDASVSSVPTDIAVDDGVTVFVLPEVVAS
jgi:hypothetical protein